MSSTKLDLVCLDQSGHVLAAEWARGVADTLAWVRTAGGDQAALLFVDAPLVVMDNPSGQRGVSGRSSSATAGAR